MYSRAGVGTDMKSIVVLLLLVLAALLGPTSAYTLDSVSVSPDHIFKCQPGTIYGNLSEEVDAVYLKLTVKHDLSVETHTMTHQGGGVYKYVYGNDNTTTWGNKTVSFIVTDAAVNYTNSTDYFIFVYSDDCVGTGISNISIGIGNYTNRLQQDGQFLQFFVQPYLDYWGSAFYLIVLFIMISVIYIKNQDISQPILMGFISLAALAASGLMPLEYRNVLMMLMAAALAGIFWKVFKS